MKLKNLKSTEVTSWELREIEKNGNAGKIIINY